MTRSKRSRKKLINKTFPISTFRLLSVFQMHFVNILEVCSGKLQGEIEAYEKLEMMFELSFKLKILRESKFS